jgi:hypothetical protein
VLKIRSPLVFTDADRLLTETAVTLDELAAQGALR